MFSSNDHSVVSAEREDGVHQFMQNCSANGTSNIDGERWGMGSGLMWVQEVTATKTQDQDLPLRFAVNLDHLYK